MLWLEVNVKDVLDKDTLGTKLWDHIRKHGLPRYQWTFLAGEACGFLHGVISLP